MSPQSMVSGIKLFGMRIPVPESQIPIEPTAVFMVPEEPRFKVACSTVSSRNLETGGADKAQVGPQTEEPQAGKNGHEQEKTLKKPDKILPCPRCNSFDTKFCYFNNYNVNQPRYFCKNCQRYWTAGGTVRNVPVGAGRRKNKQFASSSQYRQAMMSVSDIVSPNESASPLCLTPLGARGTAVFKLGPETTLSESMDSVLNLGDPVSFSESREELSSASEPETNSSGSCDSSRNPHQQIPALFFPYWQNHFPQKQVCDGDSIRWGSPVVAIPLAVLNGSVAPSSSIVNSSCCLRNGSLMLGKHSRDGDMGGGEIRQSL
ncbi:hypothetical protein SAY86_017213 [Trapa natans]|uniref:Dof-type domain-containing protein n=1 Tax=Trapa natans TaxID=22666 RepID=A0AAN7LQX8_TRANT|nr:hypothetical protein SAY86_017213 [Trapa natans]